MSHPLKTGKASQIWLLGHVTEKICCTKLPSIGDILRRLFYLTNEKKTVRDASNLVYSEIFHFWDKAKIPIRDKQHVLAKIRKLYGEYRLLQKSRSKRSQIQSERESKFKDSLDNLFDIAHANAMTMISNEEDRLFLKAQRGKGRVGYMSNVDKKYVAKESKRLKRDEQEEGKRVEGEIRRKIEESAVRLTSSSDESSVSPNTNGEPHPGPSGIKELNDRESASTSGESSFGATDVAAESRVPSNIVEDGSMSEEITGSSNSIYIQESSHDTGIINSDTVESAFDRYVSTEPLDNKMNDALSRCKPTICKDYVADSVSTKNEVEDDEFDAFGRYVAASLRKMPAENALSVENRIYTVINNERKLILLNDRNKSDGNVLEIKVEVQDEPL